MRVEETGCQIISTLMRMSDFTFCSAFLPQLKYISAAALHLEYSIYFTKHMASYTRAAYCASSSNQVDLKNTFHGWCVGWSQLGGMIKGTASHIYQKNRDVTTSSI